MSTCSEGLWGTRELSQKPKSSSTMSQICLIAWCPSCVDNTARSVIVLSAVSRDTATTAPRTAEMTEHVCKDKTKRSFTDTGYTHKGQLLDCALEPRSTTTDVVFHASVTTVSVEKKEKRRPSRFRWPLPHERGCRLTMWFFEKV